MTDVRYTLQKTHIDFEVQGLFTIYHSCFDKDYKFKGEVHNFWELVYVKEGSIGITAHDKIFELNQGEVVFHRPGEFHSIWSTQDTYPKVFIISFSLNIPLPALESTIMPLSKTSKKIIELLMEETQLLYTQYDSYLNTNTIKWLKEPLYAIDQAIKNYLELLIIEVIREKNEKYITVNTKPLKLKNYNTIITYIEENLSEVITIETICLACNISKSALKNIFKKYIGIGAMEYVNQMKIHKAIELFDLDYSSKEIADYLAFSSPYYFSTVFKRIIGMSPTEYKKKF